MPAVKAGQVTRLLQRAIYLWDRLKESSKNSTNFRKFCIIAEEEIDVVSVGDKTLPTNPSARDRRTIQTTISDRIVKTTPRGLKTIPPRRIAPDTHGHMTGRTKMSHSVSASPYVHTSRNGGYKGQTVRKGKNDTGRKRSGSKLDGPASKKHKGKKGRVSNTKSARASDICEQDSIEKRNLHNDMERQRRIGLKNLFEALKAQIPSLRDNERAPKVNILREASILCTQLHNESERLNNLKRHHANIQNRLKVIRGISHPAMYQSPSMHIKDLLKVYKEK
uniref:BHLH domain-containing protein n=1 Tax=Lutzomyia longipalpis TaxID=7200 RepID=A0A1B0ETK6_LUTLO